MQNLKPPFLLDTDTYKLGHSRMYPSNVQEMSAYFTCRGPLLKDDSRIVFYGMRYLFDTVLSRQITIKDIEDADRWLQQHGVGNTPMEWPKQLWIDVVQKYNGYIPVEVKALREGTVIHPQLPCFEIIARKGLMGEDFQYLVTYLETQLMRIWSPIVTATKSAMAYDVLKQYFERTVDTELHFLLESRLHDFGSRGVSSSETAMTTGLAHLTSFDGTDTMTAGWLATKYNNGKHVGTSVLATEHSVMTCWESELGAVINAIDIAPEGSILSVVADSYDYQYFLNKILPVVAPMAKAKNLYFVVRPDSGNPVQSVVDALRACEKVFGCTVNSKGYKLINGAGVIQGDGINLAILKEIARAVEKIGFSAANVAYGMGGGLLQKQDRDTLKVAIKLSTIVTDDGVVHGKMKKPETDVEKTSLPGPFYVYRINGHLQVFPKPIKLSHGTALNELETIWSSGPVGYHWETIDEVRERIKNQFPVTITTNLSLSNPMRERVKEVAKGIVDRV